MISTFIIKVVERCNISCDYCYYYNFSDKRAILKPKKMQFEVFCSLVSKIYKYCQIHPGKVSICFHGGEPMLLNPIELEKFISTAICVLGDKLHAINVQTNATLISQGHCDVLKRYKIDVSVSLDGGPEQNDLNRKTYSGGGTFQLAFEGVQLLRRNGIHPAVLCVINPRSEGVEVYRALVKLGFSKINFLIPDCTHEDFSVLYGDVGPDSLFDYLIPIFEEWIINDVDRIDVQPFLNIVKKIFGLRPSTDAFSTQPMKYSIVRSDGAVEGLDVLNICEPGMAETGLNIMKDEILDLCRNDTVAGRFIRNGSDLPSKCAVCELQKVCEGGYLPHRYSKARGFNNPSVWCGGLYKLISYIYQHYNKSHFK